MKVKWTLAAQRDLRSIHAYIARDSVQNADRMIDRIIRQVDGLDRFPRLGPEVQEYEEEVTRELLEYPYRIIYKLYDDRIDIVGVIHGARELPDDL